MQSIRPKMALCTLCHQRQAVSAHEGGMPLTRALEDGNGQGTRQGVILGGEGSHLLWNKDGALDTQFGLSCQRGFI